MGWAALLDKQSTKVGETKKRRFVRWKKKKSHFTISELHISLSLSLSVLI